jgi:hypothetical protein
MAAKNASTPTTSHNKMFMASVISFSRGIPNPARTAIRANKPAMIGSGSASMIRQITKSEPKNGSSQTSARV